MTLVAVARDKHARGVDVPGKPASYCTNPKRRHRPGDYDPNCPHTNDWRCGFSPSKNAHRIVAAYEVLDLDEVLPHKYMTDAMIVTYVMRKDGELLSSPSGMEGFWQPRVNKPGLPWLASEGYEISTEVMFADIDTPNHVPWTPDLLDSALTLIGRCELFRTAALYFTRAGWRVVQPLTQKIMIEESEEYLRAWLIDLERSGLSPFKVDLGCSDWTRHYRVPKGVREDGYEVDFETFGDAVAIPPSKPARTVAIPAKPRGSGSAPVQRTYTASMRKVAQFFDVEELSPEWQDNCRALAEAVKQCPQDTVHDMYLALAGALLKRGVEPEKIPAIINCVCDFTSSKRPLTNLQGAQRTIDRFFEGLPNTAMKSLRARWPLVATVVTRVTAQNREARIQDDINKPQTPAFVVMSLEEARELIKNTLLFPPDGVIVIWVDCGVGKSYAAWQTGMIRASINQQGDDERAKSGSKTGISFDKNSLAIQIQRNIIAAGGKVQRVFGPASYRLPDGTPGCKFPEQAAALAAGGQSVQSELCEGRGKSPCPYQLGCPAFPGKEGPDGALITLSSHALMSKASRETGAGVFVIDEPPAWLETIELKLSDMEHARKNLSNFSKRFQRAILPSLTALIVWTQEPRQETTPAYSGVEIREAIAQASDAIDYREITDALEVIGEPPTGDPVVDAIRCGSNALNPKTKGKSPPLRPQSDKLRGLRGHAIAVGRASRVLRSIRDALGSTARVTVRVEERGPEPVLLITMPNRDLEAVLTRQGSCVVMDANADLHLPILRTILGYDPPVVRVAVKDAVPVKRTVVLWETANRKHWFDGRRLVWKAGYTQALRTAIEFALEDPSSKSLCLITYQVARLAIEWSLGRRNEEIEKKWKSLGSSTEELQEIKKQIDPILSMWKGDLILGHYGGVRGMDDALSADTLITVGDPWPNLGSVRHDCAYLNIAGWEERLEALAKAEEEQAHGRGRTPSRTTPLRACHVGALLPGGHAWQGAEVAVRVAPGGRPRAIAAMTGVELRALMDEAGVSIRELAKLIGKAKSSIQRFLTGEIVLSEPVKVLILEALERRPGGCTREGLLDTEV